MAPLLRHARPDTQYNLNIVDVLRDWSDPDSFSDEDEGSICVQSLSVIKCDMHTVSNLLLGPIPVLDLTHLVHFEFEDINPMVNKGVSDILAVCKDSLESLRIELSSKFYILQDTSNLTCEEHNRVPII